MIQTTTHTRDDGSELTICQVREASNPLGEHWVVSDAEYAGNRAPATYPYAGPDADKARETYERLAARRG